MYMLAPHTATRAAADQRRALKESQRMTLSPAPEHDTLLRTLCIVVFATMVLSVVYAAWISIANFGRIGV
jgi:hypothetical protein